MSIFVLNLPQNAWVLSLSTPCRASAGVCDVAENCTGSSATCPTDAVATTSKVCRPHAGPCDKAENCDGSTKACPSDVFFTPSKVCRATAGECDEAERCSGTVTTCSKDLFKPDNTPCLSGAGLCTGGKCLLKPDMGTPDAGLDGAVDALADGQGDSASDAKGEASSDQSTVDQSTTDLQPTPDVSIQDGPVPGADQTPPPDAADCSCRVGDAPGSLPSPLLLLGLSLLVLVFRRRNAA